jgi:uncharacterized membrane protein YjdF
MIFLKKGQLPLLLINLIMIVGFTLFYVERKNYEFIMYIGVIVLILALILFTNKRHNLSNGLLWGLTFWGFLHMAGGSFVYNGEIWYKQVLINIWNSSEFVILRYDQFVHFVGFLIATVIGYELLKPYLIKKPNWKVLSVLVVMMGIGIGALNELMEFFAVLLFPETGVGGYYNTLWDLVFDSLGSIVAVIWIHFRKK